MVKWMSSGPNQHGSGHFGVEVLGRWFLGVYYYGWPALTTHFHLDIVRRYLGAPVSLKMMNGGDPDWPVAWFWTDTAGRSGMRVATRMRLYELPCVWAWWIVAWCRAFHRRRTYGMPAAADGLYWPVTCEDCGNQYELRTPYGYKSPWTKDPDWPLRNERKPVTKA
jgi:hypothetical protein